jgi:hypothetical protein
LPRCAHGRDHFRPRSSLRLEQAGWFQTFHLLIKFHPSVLQLSQARHPVVSAPAGAQLKPPHAWCPNREDRADPKNGAKKKQGMDLLASIKLDAIAVSP